MRERQRAGCPLRRDQEIQLRTSGDPATRSRCQRPLRPLAHAPDYLVDDVRLPVPVQTTRSATNAAPAGNAGRRHPETFAHRGSTCLILPVSRHPARYPGAWCTHDNYRLEYRAGYLHCHSYWHDRCSIAGPRHRAPVPRSRGSD